MKIHIADIFCLSQRYVGDQGFDEILISLEPETLAESHNGGFAGVAMDSQLAYGLVHDFAGVTQDESSHPLFSLSEIIQ
jgi:hypothetical protein